MDQPNPTLTPIGVVRCAARQRSDMTTLGMPATIELFPQFAAGLHRFEKHSHVWVLAWLHETPRDVLQVTPRGVRQQAPEQALHGVFAVRSPARPNPIGLTVARVLARRPNGFDVGRLDFIDGTLVIDLKPYFPTRDLVYSARSAQVGKPASVEAIRDALLMQAELFCGELTPDACFAAAVLARFRAEQLQFIDPPSWRIWVPASRPHLIDAILAMTRVRFGAGDIQLTASDELTISAGGAQLTCTVPPPGELSPDTKPARASNADGSGSRPMNAR